MEIKINNCNSVDEGIVVIEENRLNIKYAVNGTGKTTISKALQAFLSGNDEEKKKLIPFKFRETDSGVEPDLSGYERFRSVAVFDEEYVQSYVFQADEIIKNSFEIFVKTANYDRYESEIAELISCVSSSFAEDSDLGDLIYVFETFVRSFGKAKSGYSKAGEIAKGLGKGNNIDNIPSGLEVYEPYLHSPSNVDWLRWQLAGKEYLEIADTCPYCASNLQESHRDTILDVGNEYDRNSVTKLTRLLTVFDGLKPYLSTDTTTKLTQIYKSSIGLTDNQIKYLIEIKDQANNVLQQLNKLKSLGFHTLKYSESIRDALAEYRISISECSNLQSELMGNIVEELNSRLDKVIEVAGRLQGQVNQQKRHIKNTIDKYSKEINDFLFYAGYKYQVSIEYEEDSNYRLLLRHIDSNSRLENANEHLSYGERNAFALVLFMYETISNNVDLVILDDPISSFDGNKKFAILNMLFMGKTSLKNSTVLLFTHEFGTVIDAIKNMSGKIEPSPTASFLSNKDGELVELPIRGQDIKSFVNIAEAAFVSNIDSLNKLVYFRRLQEMEGDKGIAWQLASNVFHRRENPTVKCEDGTFREMTDTEIERASLEIRSRIPNFTYENEYQKTQDVTLLIDLYRKSSSNYEKMQLFRIIFNENHSNDVIRKFINESFHVENDYLFQLDPRDYDTIPQYVIAQCNQEIRRVEDEMQSGFSTA
ncbi:AAA family ATPase [Boudabousia marimammalium]|nr:AAA family ATPase [Boudabousia marimammalium]